MTEKEMQQEVTADASSLSDEINKSGRVAVYGIHFDTGKATIQPGSETTLGEIVKPLQQNPGLKLRTERPQRQSGQRGNSTPDGRAKNRRVDLVKQ